MTGLRDEAGDDDPNWCPVCGAPREVCKALNEDCLRFGTDDDEDDEDDDPDDEDEDDADEDSDEDDDDDDDALDLR